MMNLYIARHAETDYSVKGLINSDPAIDVHLTPRGKEQASELYDQLKDINFDAIIASSMSRTYETAIFIAQPAHREIVRDARLNDLRMGFEGQKVDAYRTALAASDDMWNVRFNDGESLNDLSARVADFLAELKTKPYENVLIISHMSVIQLMVGQLRGLNPNYALAIPVEQGKYILEVL